jgi:hypothetical protein
VTTPQGRPQPVHDTRRRVPGHSTLCVCRGMPAQSGRRRV